MPPWMPPHPGQPTSTGRTVVFPSCTVVNQVLAVQALLEVNSVERSGGAEVSVPLMRFTSSELVTDVDPATVGVVTLGFELGPLCDPGSLCEVGVGTAGPERLAGFDAGVADMDGVPSRNALPSNSRKPLFPRETILLASV